MKNTMTRRTFVRIGLIASASAAVAAPAGGFLPPADLSSEDFCIALCNHWSYTGIGWQLGIESCVLSVTDAMGMADRLPHVKTCLELDARAYELMAEKFPEVAERLKEYLAADKVELIGGTYGQPLGTMFSGESNIRQLVYGRETIRKALGYEMVTFLDEEEFSHPQIPQIALGAGYRYASLAQVDTWGNAGIPHLEVNAFEWKGMDGSAILSTPKNSLFGYSPNLKQLATSEGFQKLKALGKPLIFTWEEFGWEPPDEPAYLKTPEKYRKIAEESPVEFVTLKGYLNKYGSSAKESIYLNMDAWTKLLTWGLGGDQLRVMDRKVEAILLAAERFDAVASSLGAKDQAQALDGAWKHLLTSQSHDVSLCEYSRWQGDRMAPLDRLEDYHNSTWGTIGYHHLDEAEKQGRAVLDSSLHDLVSRIGSEAGKQGQLAVTVFNPCAWERTDVVTTGRIYPIPAGTRDIVVKDSSGGTVLSQIIKSDRDGEGNLIVADLAFLTGKVPSLGYDTYYLDLTSEPAGPPASELRINEQELEMENEHLSVKLGANGAIVSLVRKRTGREILDAGKGAFPVFKGTPNQDYFLSSPDVAGKYRRQPMVIPALLDSSKAVAVLEGAKQDAPAADRTHPPDVPSSTMSWIERGRLRATLKARHNWPFLQFETHVTLCAGLPWVEVTCRVLTEVPPAPDALGADHRFPVEIKQGYWLTLAPGFQPASVVRDFPLGIEPTERQAFQARTFVDLVGKDDGLLVLHLGTQYFKRESDGVFSNLIMREWESYFTGEYGWPRYSEYHYALLPHDGGITNAHRLRAAEGFSQKLITAVSQPQDGSLPARKGFITIDPENAHLSALRIKDGQRLELRVVEIEGGNGNASVKLPVRAAGASETNLLGERIGPVTSNADKLSFELQPWKVRTFEVG